MDLTNLSLIATEASKSPELAPVSLGEVLRSDAPLDKFVMSKFSGLIALPGLVTAPMHRVAFMAVTSPSDDERRELREALDCLTAKRMALLFKNKHEADRPIDGLPEVKKMRT